MSVENESRFGGRSHQPSKNKVVKVSAKLSSSRRGVEAAKFDEADLKEQGITSEDLV